MSASETMWDEDSPRVDTGEVHQFDLPQQEVMLKRKAALLEEFLRNDGMEPRSVEDRCEILQQRVDSLEEELSIAGKLDAARRYIEHAPRSDFDAINRDEFMSWFGGSERLQTENLQPGRSIQALLKKTPVRNLKQIEGGSQPRSVSHRSKRLRTSDRERPPCLRCRILKKRCDGLEQCSHCPEQGYDNVGDFWKVLGCFREPLHGLSALICPHFSRSTKRVLRHRNGATETINLLLTKSRVSAQKRGRILNLVHTNIDFAHLKDSSWEDVTQRRSVSVAAASFSQLGDETLFGRSGVTSEDYEAPWSVLQAISMDSKYLTPTEYNFFVLIRLGNEFSKNDPNEWDLFKQAKRLLRQAVEVYLLERLCAHIASGDMVGPPPFYPASDPSSNILILVDIKDDVEKFLSAFEFSCSGRAKLAGHPQLACFFALLVFGIAKSILIDAYSIRGEYEDENPWKSTDAVAITSAYKALVSAFCWSSKTDVILQAERSDKNSEVYSAIQDTCMMVRQNQWEERGLKGTKDFLLSLGSCFSPQGNYNGFLAQKFGLGGLLKIAPKQAIGSGVATGDITSYLSGEHSSQQHTPWLSLPFDQDTPRFMVHKFTASPPSASHPQQHQKGIGNEGIIATGSARQAPEIISLEASSLSCDSATQSTSSFTFVENDDRCSQGKADRRHGGRRGALDAETLRKAREVRKLGSCWNCWTIRMACSEGTPCKRCLRIGGLTTQTCLRAPFTAYTNTFFPEFLNSQYSTRAIENYMDENTEEFTDEAMEVEITWGADITITLQAAPFIPAPNSQVQMTYSSRDGRPLGVESLPLGILPTDIPTLEQTCLLQLESGLGLPEFSALGFDRRTSELSKLVFDVVLAFYNTMQLKHALLHDLLILYLALLTIGCPTLFTESSTASILSKLQSDLPDTGLFSSRLLNLQLKGGMYNLARQMTAKVLSQLEKVFRNRDKTLWPVSFAAMLVLCLCIEQAQVLTDSHIEFLKSSGHSALAGLDDEPQRCCQALEDGPFAQLTHVFHLRYRTNKGDWAGLHPFRTDFINTNDVGFEEPAMDMIRGIREKVLVKDEMLKERDMPPKFDEGAESFAERNSGRLVSRFLLNLISLGEK